jgi:hypothetical protein
MEIAIHHYRRDMLDHLRHRKTRPGARDLAVLGFQDRQFQGGVKDGSSFRYPGNSSLFWVGILSEYDKYHLAYRSCITIVPGMGHNPTISRNRHCGRKSERHAKRKIFKTQ